MHYPLTCLSTTHEMWVTLSMLSLSDLHNTVVVVVVSDVDHEKAGECNKVFTNVTHYVLSAHPIMQNCIY